METSLQPFYIPQPKAVCLGVLMRRFHDVTQMCESMFLFLCSQDELTEPAGCSFPTSPDPKDFIILLSLLFYWQFTFPGGFSR